MKKYAYNEITTMQFIFLLSGMAISYGFIEIPSVLYEQAGTDGWITLILGTMATMAANLAVVRIMRRYPDGTLMDLLSKYAGRWAGVAIAVLFVLYFLFYAYISLVYSTRVIKARVLQETPAFMTFALLLIPTYVVARSGIRVLGRYAELSIWLSIWIPFAFWLVWKNTHWLYLLPILQDGWQPVVKGVPGTFYFFLGFISTALLYPFLQKKEKAALGVVCAQLLTMTAYLFITVLCFVFFSPNEMKEINQPAIFILKTVELPFIEQVEGLFIVMYLFMFSLAWIPPFQFAAFCAAWATGRADHRLYLRVMLAAALVYAYFYVPGFDTTYALGEWLTKIGIGLEYVFPFVLLLLLWLYDRLRGSRRLR